MTAAPAAGGGLELAPAVLDPAAGAAVSAGWSAQ